MEKKWCTEEGAQGPRWNEVEYGPLKDYKNRHDESPLVCPGCGCGKGISSNRFISNFKNDFQRYHTSRYRFHIFSNFSLASKTKCNREWKGKENNNTCDYYEKEKLCKKTGNHKGEMWDDDWGEIADFTDKDGNSALVCPQCGCKEG